MDLTAASALVLGLAAMGGLSAALNGSRPVPFAGLAAAVWLIVVATLVSLRVREQDQRPLGMATRLTLLRGWLISAVAGFIVAAAKSGWAAWMPGALYTAAALCDLVDGYVARRRNEVSVIGGKLDISMDALGLLVAPAAAVSLGRLPVWYLVVGLAYYLFHGGLRWRARRGRPSHPERMISSRYTRQFAGCQMGLVATALFPVLGPPGTSITAALFMIPNLALFLRDWLVVTGRLEPAAARFPATLERTATAAALPLRVAASGGLVLLVANGALPRAVLILAALISLGVLTRLTAFGSGIVVAHVLPTHSTPAGLATFTLLMLLMLVGAGRLAIWSPEDAWMLRRAGELPPPPASRRQ
jgi:CDP-diacylglycerol--glycerol-3-phosphate 3-phosphatidyltransferase